MMSSTTIGREAMIEVNVSSITAYQPQCELHVMPMTFKMEETGQTTLFCVHLRSKQQSCCVDKYFYSQLSFSCSLQQQLSSQYITATGVLICRAVLIGVAPSLICAGIGHFGIQCADGHSNCKINHPFSSLKRKHITNDTYIFASIKEHTA
jgi:hypothetical protein